jgi:glycosyltransferase involved in cell wall biosynthesis
MKISIIVPVYNVERELPRCVDSLINQTYEDTEIILVDDGSTDTSGDICDQYGKQDKRIRVIHKINGGLSDARNAGIAKATGEYFLLIDSDDYIDLDSCEKFVEIISKTNADVIVANAKQEHGNVIEYMRHTNLQEGQIYSSSQYIKLAISAREWYAPAWLNAYKTTFFRENKLAYAKGLLHEDMEMLPRLFLKAETVSYLDKAFYHYVIRSSSIMGTLNKERNGKHLMKIYAEWMALFQNVADKKLRKLLLGNLAKHYLHTCRELHMLDQDNVAGVTKSFLLKYALDSKERLKAVAFAVAPKVYVRL